MKALTSKYGDILSHFDKIDELEDEIGNTSLHQHLINNHDTPASKGKIKGQLPLEIFFGFGKSFRKLTKKLDFIQKSKLLIYMISLMHHWVIILK